MRRSLLLGLALGAPGLLAGCTGTGVFFDHTFKAFGANPNSPAGNSQTMMRLRGGELSIDTAPILPETGNVWPGPQPPDPTLDELSRQQAEAAKKGQGQAPGQASPRPRGSSSPPQASPAARKADQSLPPPDIPPVAPPQSPESPVVQTPEGPSIDVGRTGSERGYRQLQSPNPGGTGILVPNGNGTSTLISPNGSIQTVPTRR